MEMDICMMFIFLMVVVPMTTPPLHAIIASLAAVPSLAIVFNPNDDIVLLMLVLKAINPHAFVTTTAHFTFCHVPLIFMKTI